MVKQYFLFSNKFEMSSVEYMNVDILTRSATVFGRLGILGSNFRSAIRNRRLCSCFLDNRLCELIDQCKPKISNTHIKIRDTYFTIFKSNLQKQIIAYLSSVAPCLSGIACC